MRTSARSSHSTCSAPQPTTAFFSGHGFAEIDGTPVSHEVFEQLLQSYDEGVAEFLGLERVKPNTLGNTRMLLVLN